jgi:hypothetical protein
MADYDYYRADEMRESRRKHYTQTQEMFAVRQPSRRGVYVQWVNRILWLIASLFSALLAVRFFMVMLEVDSDFADAILTITNPFANLLAPLIAPMVTDTGTLLELNVLALIAAVLVGVFILTTLLHALLRQR